MILALIWQNYHLFLSLLFYLFLSLTSFHSFESPDRITKIHISELYFYSHIAFKTKRKKPHYPLVNRPKQTVRLKPARSYWTLTLKDRVQIQWKFFGYKTNHEKKKIRDRTMLPKVASEKKKKKPNNRSKHGKENAINQFQNMLQILKSWSRTQILNRH